MASSKAPDEVIANGSFNECSKEISDSESGNNPEDISGSDEGSDSPTPSVFAKFYEAKAKGIYDTRNQDVVAFITDTMTSDSKKEDRSVLMNANSYLVESKIIETECVVTSVNWSSPDANSRRVMHKLCEFYGLNHNIRGASEPNSMTIERKPDKFRCWDFSLQELAAHLMEKQNQQTKTILKRTVDVKAASKTSGSAKDMQTQSLQSYDERQKNYNAVKQKLGITSDDNPISSVFGKTQMIRRNNRLSSPEDLSAYRKTTMKPIPSVPPLMGPVYEPLHPNRTYPQYILNHQPTVPVQQHCYVLRRVAIDHLLPSDMHNAWVYREGRWLELANCNTNGEPVFAPCDEVTSIYLNSKCTDITAGAYHTMPTAELHVSDASESYNGNPKVITSPMLSSGMSAQMISSMNGSFSTFPPQTFNQSSTPGLPMNGQSHQSVGGTYVANSPYYHPSGAPQQNQQHPPQSLTPQEHMRSSMNMPQMNQTPAPPNGDPSGGPLTNGHMVFTAPQQIALPDLGNRAAAASGHNGGQAPQGIIVGIPTGQPHHGACAGAPPPPVTVTWPVGANGPPPSIFASASHPQYLTQTGPTVGHVIRPPSVQAACSTASNFFNPVPHKIPSSSVIQQSSAGTQGMGFPGIHNPAHHSQTAPHRAFMGQPLMQVNMAGNVPGASYNNHRSGRRGPLSRQNSHNGSNGAEGSNATTGNSGGTSTSANSH